jgi:membrane associated rhomboid family serine protease
MLSDRKYMRDDYPRRVRAALPWLLSAVSAGFILDAVFQRLFGSTAFVEWFALTFRGLREWHVWQPLTYPAIHPVGSDFISLLVVMFNLLCLYFVGRETEGLLGTTRFVGLYLGATLLGAAAWAGVHFHTGGLLAGTWPGIAGCIVLFALINPDQELSVLFFFVPLRFAAKYLAWGLLAYDALGLLAWEILGRASPIGDNHAAHLGGMLAGYLYFTLIHKREWRTPDRSSEIELPKWLKKSRKAAAAGGATTGNFKLNITNREDLRTEVDRILDKINSQGFASLTPEEKQLLDDARNQISRR